MDTNPTTEENKSALTQTFKREFLKEGLSITMLPIPDDLLRLIGLVVAYWGNFEVRFDKAIEAALKVASAGKQVNDWQRLGFKKRKELFKKLIHEYDQGYPTAVAALEKVCRDAAELHWQRNTVAHGSFHFHFPPAGPESPTIEARGIHNNKAVVISIDEETLGKLWHDIAHLIGALVDAFKLVGTVEGELPTLPDIELLRLFRATSRPTPPKQEEP